MNIEYPALITLQKNRAWIEVPDFGILLEAKDREEAYKAAQDAIMRKCDSMIAQQKRIPQPSYVDELDIENVTYLNDGVTVVVFINIDHV